MDYSKRIFEVGRPVHIINRAVDGKEIFSDQENCYRFVFQIYTANLGVSFIHIERRDINKIAFNLLQGIEPPGKIIVEAPLSSLVDILDFSLVVNHYHFFLLPKHEGAISLFMQRLNIAFAKFFNLKYGRRGTLFESRYKFVVAETEFQSDAISRYVGIINPLDVCEPGWREEGLKNPEKAFEFLKNYEFSSFPDKIGIRKSLILAPEEIRRQFSPLLAVDNKEDYYAFVKEFLLEHKANPLKSLFLE